MKYKNMKKFMSAAALNLLLVSGAAFAQVNTLPSAGLTPENPFYFFDRLGEALQRFFTFNPESRARLEITFAKERVAEIKLILDEKGINAKGLTVAEAGLQDNLSRATAVLTEEKQSGKDMARLAGNLSDEIDQARGALKESFKSQKDALKTKEDELKAKIKEARRAGDAAQIDALLQELGDIKAQKELLDQNENENESVIDEENDRVDEAMGLKNEAAEKIRDAEKDKEEILSEIKDKNITVPAETFIAFDNLLSQAKAAFDAGNYEDAKRLAKEAKKNLKNAEKSLEKLEDAQEKEDELKQEADERRQEAEEKLKEADAEEAETIREEAKRHDEQLKKEREKIKDEKKRIEEQLKKQQEED